MRIIRVTSSGFPEMVKNHLRENVEEQDAYAQRLSDNMRQVPEKMYVVAAIDGADVVGFIVLGAFDEDVQTFMFNAWVKSGVDSSVTEDLLLRAIIWTLSLGRTGIRAETTREKSLMRRWGFEKKSTIIELNVPKNVDAKELVRFIKRNRKEG